MTTQGKRRSLVRMLELGLLFFVVLFSGTILMTNLSLSKQRLKDFLEAGADFAALRVHSHEIFAAAAAVKKVIPPDSRVTIPYKKMCVQKVAARYALYPLKVSPDYQYFVDVGRSLKAPPLSWIRRDLSPGSCIYALPGQGFGVYGGPQRQPGLWVVLVFAAVVVLNIFTGMNIARLAGWEAQSANTLWLWGAGYLLGFVVLTSSVWIFLLAGGTLSRGSVLAVWGLVSGGVCLCTRNTPSARCGTVNRDCHATALSRGLALCVGVVAAVFFLTIAVTPVTDWDAMSNWIMKAKVLSRQGVLDFSGTHHNYYPILWPLNIASQFTLLGFSHDEVAQWNSAFFYLAFLSQWIGGLSLLGLRGKRLWGTALVCLIGLFSYDFMNSANAENAFLALNTAAVVFFMQWVRSPQQRGVLLTGSVMALGLSLIKLEGAVTVVCLVLSLLLLKARRGAFSNRSGYGVYAILSGIVALPWLWTVWIKQRGWFNSLLHLTGPVTVEKVRVLLGANAGFFLRSELFVVLVFGVLFLVLNRERPQWRERETFLLAVSVLLVSFSFIANVGQNLDLSHLPPDVPRRLLVHAAPSLVLLFGSRMSCGPGDPAVRDL